MSSVIEWTEEDLNSERRFLEERWGEVWDTKQLTDTFKVEAFAAPFVLVQHRESGDRGSLDFQHRPRFYYRFTKIEEES
tara:strand:- start:290 stop:526 length:237 start_codon:yes stop_codon:yes gene_type:complete